MTISQTKSCELCGIESSAISFRLSSSPDADSRLVVLRDAGIDRQARCFLMVLSARDSNHSAIYWTTGQNVIGFATCAKLKFVSPLCAHSAKSPTDLPISTNNRCFISTLTPECVFVDGRRPESMRLGGFEWTVKVGQALPAQPRRRGSCS